MNRKKLTPQEKYMLTQQQLETELARLRKEFLVLDKSRSGSSFMKYSKVIELYKKEHMNILNDLMRAKNPGRKKEDAKIFDNLFMEISHYNRLGEYVTKQKVHIKEIENEIKTVKKSVSLLSKQQVTDRQHQDRVWAIMKTVEALENKLETQMIKFGTICTKNKALREEIDHLLWDRRNFLQHWHKFINRLAAGKHIMLDLIEQATIAYNQREEWCNKLQALRVKAHQDLMANMQEMRDYMRMHDESQKLEEFFLVKGQKRQMRDLKQKVVEKRMNRLREMMAKQKNYEEMLQKIKEFTNQKKIEGIARQFVIQDEENLSKFKYVINLLNEMEDIGDKLGCYHMDIEEKNMLNNSRSHQQHKAIEMLEEKLKMCTQEGEEAEAELKKKDHYLHRLLDGVASLFKICKCNQDPLLRLLGDNESVQFYNVKFYVDILESRVQELLVTVNYNEKIMVEKRKMPSEKLTIKPEEVSPRIYQIEDVVKVTPCSLCVEHEMVADVIDYIQQPMDRELALAGLKRRLQTPGGLAKLHNISHCQLPQSRATMQKRYQ